jgi:SAM-dependent methyltransferase
LVLGCSDDLPFSDAAFDKALAVHTIYFWPSPERDLAEILRVLVPDGKLVLGFRPGDDPGFAQGYPSEIYNIRAAAAVEEAVRSAGFVDVRTEILTSHSGLLAFTEARKRLDPKE